jgi:uncharacterized membrane protein
MVDLGSAFVGRHSYATGVSGDGRVVVGYQDRENGLRSGTRWVDGRQELFPGVVGGSSSFVGSAHAANHDGSIIVGENCRPLGTSEGFDQSAWLWTERDGIQCLPAPRLLPAPVGLTVVVEAIGVSDDGRSSLVSRASDKRTPRRCSGSIARLIT